MKRSLIVLGLLVVVSSAIYGGTLRYPFVFDDNRIILNNDKIKDPSNIPGFFYERSLVSKDELSSFRALLFTTYALNYMASGLNPVSYRLVDILLHVLNAFFVYLIACALLRASPARGPGKPDKDAPDIWLYALAASLLFAVHPIQTESVVYVSARSTVLVSACCLASLWLLIRYITRRNAAWLAAATLVYAMALLSKETAVPFLLVFPLVGYALGRDGKSVSRAPLRAYAPLAVAAVAFTARRAALLTSDEQGKIFVRSVGDHIVSSVAMLPKYALLTLWPFGLCADHDIRTISGLSNANFLLGALIIALSTAAFVYFFRRRPVVSALVALPLLVMSPEMVVPIGDLLVEYRMYLPLASLSILAAYAFRHALGVLPKGKARAAAAVFALIIAVLSVLSYERLQVWSGAKLLWSDVIAKYPYNPRAHSNLGMALQSAGYLNDAIMHLKIAVNLAPENPTIHYNLGTSLHTARDYKGALEQMKIAVSLDPKSLSSLNNLGNAYAETGEFENAVEAYRKALALAPTDFAANYNLALTYLDMGDFDTAYAAFADMVGMFPENSNFPYQAAQEFVFLGRQDIADRFIGEFARPVSQR